MQSSQDEMHPSPWYLHINWWGKWMDQLCFILLVLCISISSSLSCLALSVICVYDNHCCVRLSVQLFTKESKYRKKTPDSRHPPPLMFNKNLVVDNIWLRMWWLSEHYRKNQCVFVGRSPITRMFPARWLLLLWINQENSETQSDRGDPRSYRVWSGEANIVLMTESLI